MELPPDADHGSVAHRLTISIPLPTRKVPGPRDYC